jgi:hypothetical protein
MQRLPIVDFTASGNPCFFPTELSTPSSLTKQDISYHAMLVKPFLRGVCGDQMLNRIQGFSKPNRNIPVIVAA